MATKGKGRWCFSKQTCCFLKYGDVQLGALAWFFFFPLFFLGYSFLNGSLVSFVFLGGLPMKKNILKASNSCLKKEILKTEVPLGHWVAPSCLSGTYKLWVSFRILNFYLYYLSIKTGMTSDRAWGYKMFLKLESIKPNCCVPCLPFLIAAIILEYLCLLFIHWFHSHFLNACFGSCIVPGARDKWPET